MRTTIFNEKIVDNYQAINAELLQIKKDLCHNLKAENRYGGFEYIKEIDNVIVKVIIYIKIEPLYEQYKDIEDDYYSKYYVDCDVNWSSSPSDFNNCLLQAKLNLEACQEVQKIIEKYKDVIVWDFNYHQTYIDDITHKAKVEADKERIYNLNFDRMRVGTIRQYDITPILIESLVNTAYDIHKTGKSYKVNVISSNQVTVTRIS